MVKCVNQNMQQWSMPTTGRPSVATPIFLAIDPLVTIFGTCQLARGTNKTQGGTGKAVNLPLR